MMDETYLINNIKKSCCFVSQDFSADLEKIKSKKGGEVKYVLPDYSHSKEGYVLKEGHTIGDDQQVLVLGNERFAIPEILFTPTDVGNNLESLNVDHRVETRWYFRRCYTSCRCFTSRIKVFITCEYRPCRGKL